MEAQEMMTVDEMMKDKEEMAPSRNRGLGVLAEALKGVCGLAAGIFAGCPPAGVGLQIEECHCWSEMWLQWENQREMLSAYCTGVSVAQSMFDWGDPEANCAETDDEGEVFRAKVADWLRAHSKEILNLVNILYRDHELTCGQARAKLMGDSGASDDTSR